MLLDSDDQLSKHTKCDATERHCCMLLVFTEYVIKITRLLEHIFRTVFVIVEQLNKCNSLRESQNFV